MGVAEKVESLVKHHEFGKAMETVRQNKIFQSLPFEERDRELFPEEALAMKCPSVHYTYGETIVMDQFCADNVKYAIKLSSQSSAPGLSGISNSHLKLVKD